MPFSLCRLWGLILSLVFLTACADHGSSLVTTRLSGQTMGTSYHITLVSEAAPADAESLQKGIDDLLAKINSQMSTYQSDSELMRLNGSAVGEWHPVSAELLEVLKLSSEVGDQTDGAFDITLKPLIELWGFGTRQTGDTLPGEQQISDALQSVDYRSLQIDLKNRHVRFSKPIELDLSAVAKGFAVDQVLLWLQQQGYDNLLVEIGGEIRVSGHNPKGVLWRIGIENPVAGLYQSARRAISLDNVAVATSGDYRNFFEVDGQRYSHTLDPRTGKPVTHNLVSVTVVDSEAGRADALATGYTALGAEAALPLANSQGVAAFFIIKQGEQFVELASSAFEAYLEESEAE